MMDDNILELRGIYKRFQPGAWVVEDFNLAVQRGGLVCLLGPSGCGKTTLLRLICGFESPDKGILLKEGATIGRPGWGVPPEKRRIGMVFQDYALFPHLSVYDNVSFGLKPGLFSPLALARKVFSKLSGGRATASMLEKGAAEHLAALFELTGLEGMEQRFPHELSGGQQQRVALARALAHRPDLVLLDEPFSNLDTALRQRIREEVRTVLRRSSTTSILVTHDQEEAVNMADRIAVVNQGSLEQFGSPDEILNNPRSRFVAGFVGLSSFIPGRVVGDAVESELGQHPLLQNKNFKTGMAVDMLLRPNYLRQSQNGSGVRAHVKELEYLGTQPLYTLALSTGSQIQAALPGYPILSPGESVSVEFLPPYAICFPKA